MPENDALTHNTDTVVVHKQIGITAVSSPLPPPELLERYKGISPKLLDELLEAIRTQQQASIEQSKKILDERIRLAKADEKAYLCGLFSALIVCLAGFVLCGVMVIAGHPNVAAILCGGELAALVCAFLYVRRRS